MTNQAHPALLSEADLIERIFTHIDNGTTDLGDRQWQEPVANYLDRDRFEREMVLLRSRPVVFCPSSAVPDPGSYQARTAAGTPLVVVRGADQKVRAFINACRHRGMQLTDGQGCARALTCPYHGWTYELDGRLKGVPGKAGFPGIDMQSLGLAEVDAVESGGLVYVQQQGSIAAQMLDHAPAIFDETQTAFSQLQITDDYNWKLMTETFLEGYHIKSLHRESFLPFGFDNTNVVETFGPNSRIVYPFRRIENIRHQPAAERRIEGTATVVYHLFPNVIVAELSKHTSVTIIEPLSPSRTQLITYHVTLPKNDERSISLEDAMRDIDFVNRSGQEEDRAAARAIQQTVTTPANTHFTFGLYEKAIVSFHSNLHLALESNTAA